ncbi:MAG: hypothetical protein HY907_20420 [Deltaproteobacteria bacterium]|nr:hypothetical protein [Deltaproteobacteria bacterium]
MLLSGLRILLRWRRAWISAGVSLLLAVGLLLVPQFDVLGFEAAFAVAVLMPVFAGALGAGFRRSGLPEDRPWASLAALLVAAEALVAVPLLLVAANMVRAPICDPWEGLLFFLLLPAFSAALAAVAGWFLALAVRRPAVALLLWLVVFLASLVLVAWRFYATPAVSFFGPFFGQYPGVLYDTLVPITGRLLTYRATNLLEAGILLAVAAFAWDPATHRISARRLLRSRLAALVLLPALASAAALYALGPALGHRTDTESIGKKLGRLARGETCDVWAPREWPLADHLLLLEDCEFRVSQIRRFAGMPPHGERLTVLAFRSETEKVALMGAGRTSVAKPWRREVYIQGGNFPHSVLKHELAHVLLGELCPGPFHVPARWGGLLPLPGLVEGGAVAADWPVDELSPHGWAAAMDRLGLLPSPQTLVGVGFLGENAGLAYTATGSFVRWLVENAGADAFRAVFVAGDFEGSYGRPLDALWAEWRQWLHQRPLTPEQVASAEARFAGPGFFRLRCPHAVAAAAERRDRELFAGDRTAALAAQDDACRLSGNDPWQRVARLALLVAVGYAADAEAAADTLAADHSLGGRLLDVVAALRADAVWLQDRPAEARAEYQRLLPRATSSLERRLLLSKIHATAQPRTVQSYLRDYLAGRPLPGRTLSLPAGSDVQALDQAARLAPDDPVAHYLRARGLLNLGEWSAAAEALDRALALGFESEAFRLEALSQRLTLRYRFGDLPGAETDARALEHCGTPEYEAKGSDWLERIAWKRARSGLKTEN